MNKQPRKPIQDSPIQDSKVEGEGSYTAAHDYKESIDKFMKDKSGDIDKMAHDASEALDSDEAEDLKSAEKKGLKRAKH